MDLLKLLICVIVVTIAAALGNDWEDCSTWASNTKPYYTNPGIATWIDNEGHITHIDTLLNNVPHSDTIAIEDSNP